MSQQNAKTSGELDSNDVLFEIPSISSSSVFLQFSASGRVGVRRRSSVLDEPKTRSIGSVFQQPIPLTVNGKSDIYCPLGLIVLSGQTAVGKSDFVRRLENRQAVFRVLAVEPPSPYELATTPMFNTADAGLAALIVEHLRVESEIDSGPIRPPLLVLDSVRESLFEIQGSAGEKGIINAFFTTLTRVSNSLAANGLTVLATVNPMNRNPEYLAEFLSKLSSALPGFIMLEQRTDTGRSSSSEVRFTGYLEFRPERKPLRFEFSTSQSTRIEAQEVSFIVAAKSDSRTFAADEVNVLNAVASSTP